MRECGECVVCCYVCEVPELQKPLNSLCKHCTVGQGCKIYEMRPQSCRTYNCVWKEGGISDERLRPDRCGVLFDRVGKFLVAITGEGNRGAWKQPVVQEEIKQHLENGTPVIAREGNGEQWHALVPANMRSEEVVDGFKKAVKEDKRWRRLDTPQT